MKVILVLLKSGIEVIGTVEDNALDKFTDKTFLLLKKARKVSSVPMIRPDGQGVQRVISLEPILLGNPTVETISIRDEDTFLMEEPTHDLEVSYIKSTSKLVIAGAGALPSANDRH